MSNFSFLSIVNIVESYSWFLNIFDYLTWEEIQNLALVNKNMAHVISREETFFRFNQKLASQNNVFIPSSLPHGFTHRSFFLHVFPSRDVWQAEQIEDVSAKALHSYQLSRKANSRSKISVYAKFKPLSSKELQEQNELEESLASSNSPPPAPPSASSSSSSSSSSMKDTPPSPSKSHKTKGAYLPLHQKLAMLKLSHNLKDNKSALRLLTEEGNWFDSRWNEVEKLNSGKENSPNTFIVSARNGEKSQELSSLFLSRQKNQELKAKNKDYSNSTEMLAKVQQIDEKNSAVVMMTRDVGLRCFTFNGVMGPETSQTKPYDLCTKKLVVDFFNGFNSTTVVYGQTGSGKTYTMFGPSFDADGVAKDKERELFSGKTTASSLSENIQRMDLNTESALDSFAQSGAPVSIFTHDSNERGIIPRVCEEVFEGVKIRQRVNGIQCRVKISYVEIFGDQVSDLLQFGARCSHSKVASQRFVLNGSNEKEVKNLTEMYKLLEQGEKQKRKAQTAMNERSSRAHNILIITLEQELPVKASLTEKEVKPKTLRSQMFLADLGGSEKVKKSKVKGGKQRFITSVSENNLDGEETEASASMQIDGEEDPETAIQIAQPQNSVGFELDDRMREAININLGLLALKKCVEALNNNALYVPYQESKLTLLLSEGLGGNSKTSIIVCGSMAAQHASETIATLRFGEKCAKVVTQAENNSLNLLKNVIDDIDTKISNLEAQIRSKERWVDEEVEVDDFIILEDGSVQNNGKHKKTISKLVGAEVERKELIRLLAERARLIGAPLLEESSTSVLGFGKDSAEMYGFGSKFNESEEEKARNVRFEGKVSEQHIPLAVKRSGNIAWATGKDLTEDAKVLEKKALKVKRTNLAYSGFSF